MPRRPSPVLPPRSANPPHPAALIAFRALQGAAVSAMMVAATAVLSDSWEPSQRGKAMGVFAIPTRERGGGGRRAGRGRERRGSAAGGGRAVGGVASSWWRRCQPVDAHPRTPHTLFAGPRPPASGSAARSLPAHPSAPLPTPPLPLPCAVVGPVVGPLLGGGLSQALGWRSTFVAVAVCGGVICVALLLFMEEVRRLRWIMCVYVGVRLQYYGLRCFVWDHAAGVGRSTIRTPG